MALFSHINKNDVSQSQAQKEVTINEAIEALAKGAGRIQKSIAAGGTINLTEDEARSGFIILTGAPGSATTVVVPSTITRAILFRNDATGLQTVQVKQGSGTNFPIAQGQLVYLLSTTEAITIRPRSAIQLEFTTATATWTDMPAAETELYGLHDRRTKFDLIQFDEVRLLANVEAVGAAGAKLRAQYSTDQSTWNDLENGAGVGPEVLIDALGLIVSSWVVIPEAARADVFLRIVGISGDGAADPQLGLIAVQVR